MLANECAVGPDIDLGIEHGAGGMRQLFAYTDNDISVRGPGSIAERRDFRAGYLYGVLEELNREPVGDRPRCGVMVVPDRMRRNKAFRKSDHPGPVLSGLLDQPARLGGRALSIEKYRRGLDGRDFYFWVAVAHYRVDPFANAMSRNVLKSILPHIHSHRPYEAFHVMVP